jgi:hypothetical protein
MIEESAMALTEVPVRSSRCAHALSSLPDGWRVLEREFPEPAAMVEQAPPRSFDAGRMRILLDEPAFALWAGEASLRYEVSALDALELLAYALLLDGER